MRHGNMVPIFGGTDVWMGKVSNVRGDGAFYICSQSMFELQLIKTRMM